MEGIHRGAYFFVTFLCNSKLQSCNAKQLSQRGGLDKVIHLQNLTEHTFPVDIQEHILPGQKEWLSTKQNGRRAAPAYKFLIGVFSRRASRIKLLPFGDKYFGAFQPSLRTDAALKTNALEQARGAHAKQVWWKLNTKTPSRWKYQGLQLLSTRSDRTECIKQALPATLMPLTPFNPHLPCSSGSVLTQPRLLPA